MKKTIILLAMTSALLYGCSNGQEAQAPTSTEKAPEVQTEIVVETEVSEEKKVEVATEKADPVQNTETLAADTGQAANEADLVKEAISIAAKDLGAAEDELIILLAEVDEDMDKEVELDVYYQGTIYEYEIRNSAIDDKEADIKVGQDVIDEMLRGDDALAIALTDAGLAETDLTDYEIELDEDKGTIKYDIELKVQERETDYKIDARTGHILEQGLDD